MSRRGRWALVALCGLMVTAVAWALVPSSSPATQTATVLPTCPLATLPREARDTVRAIHANGPFPFPHDDGVVFGNREGHLPDRTRSYYREYTVITPGAHDRSARRIVTGGSPVTDPREFFYTADHYDTFCLVTEARVRP